MEIELKYLIDDKEKVREIMEDEYIRRLWDGSEEEVIPMHAVYYDTADGDLNRLQAAFRIRQEGAQPVATIKWSGGSVNGLHKREEINVPLDSEAVDAPDFSVFEGSSIAPETMDAVEGKVMLPVMIMDFRRRVIRLEYQGSCCEFSVDEGKIMAGEGETEIRELEIELLSGSEEKILEIGSYISGKYELKTGNKSKFERGLELMA